MKRLKRWYCRHIKSEWYQKVKPFIFRLSKVASFFLIFMIRGLRPLLGAAHCKYQVGCTEFAVYQLQNKSFLKAVTEIIKRILSCNPWN